MRIKLKCKYVGTDPYGRKIGGKLFKPGVIQTVTVSLKDYINIRKEASRGFIQIIEDDFSEKAKENEIVAVDYSLQNSGWYPQTLRPSEKLREPEIITNNVVEVSSQDIVKDISKETYVEPVAVAAVTPTETIESVSEGVVVDNTEEVITDDTAEITEEATPKKRATRKKKTEDK